MLITSIFSFTYNSFKGLLFQGRLMSGLCDIQLSLLHSNLSYKMIFHLLPNDKILDLSKLKAFLGNKMNVTGRFKIVLERVDNIMGKRRKC